LSGLLIGAHAQEPVTEDFLSPTQVTLRSTLESWKLPNDDRVGMLGLNALVNVHPRFKLGIGAYSAVTGDYAGLMTFGFTGEFEQPISDKWRLRAGVFAGGGGGAAGEDLTGIGFMLRTDAGVTYSLGSYGNVGLGWSWVTFPSGEIRTGQPYLMYEYPFYSAAHSGWSTQSAGVGSNLPAQRQELSLGWNYYIVPDSVTDGAGGEQGNMEVAGVRWTSYLNDRWFASIQADGSYTSSTSGYTQLLGGIGYRLPLGASTGIKLYAQAGAGGAGNNVIDTGGGFIWGAGIALQQMLSENWAIEIGAGGLKAGSGDFKAWTLGANLTYVFGTPKVSSAAPLKQPLVGYQSAPLQLRVVNQTFFRGDDQWRNNDNIASVNNFGLAVDYYLNQNAFLTAQGLVAYTGNSRSADVTAASELTGLLGAGWHQPLSKHWFAEVQGLLGASVGGTMDTGNGAVWQANASIGYQFTRNLSLSVSGGRMQAFDGQFKTNILGVSLGYRFGVPAR
ncbi:MAG TPA: hypothetical protein VIC30_02185, partial [Orrella sp.]